MILILTQNELLYWRFLSAGKANYYNITHQRYINCSNNIAQYGYRHASLKSRNSIIKFVKLDRLQNGWNTADSHQSLPVVSVMSDSRMTWLMNMCIRSGKHQSWEMKPNHNLISYNGHLRLAPNASPHRLLCFHSLLQKSVLASIANRHSILASIANDRYTFCHCTCQALLF